MGSGYAETAGVGEWVEIQGFRLFELSRQIYAGNNCIFAVGLCDNAGVDKFYLWFEKDGKPFTCLLFRPDELASIAWLASGAVWSHLIEELGAKK